MCHVWSGNEVNVICGNAVAQRDGTRRVTDTSQDGTQTGDITLAGDGSSGRVSASSTGGRRAGSSVSLTVTGGPSTSASFSSRGMRFLKCLIASHHCLREKWWAL